jgi:hypothetical protein
MVGEGGGGGGGGKGFFWLKIGELFVGDREFG